ncbi:MAG TPA: protein translocase subunit SecD [Magnetospirillaceae bacterium]|nr:protein translocase subunit SecD [Magnetospirillaceae bacterium]
MNKTKRILIVLVVLAVGFLFLFPSIRWYFLTPRDEQILAMGSNLQIRDYAWRMARADLMELENAARSGEDAPLPPGLEWMSDRARELYRGLGRTAPSAWTARAVLAAYDSRISAMSDIEDRYRLRIQRLKNLQRNVVQLGLDLSGGMSVIIRADLPALEERMGRSLSLSEREDAMARALEVLNSRIDRFGLTEPVIRRQGEDGIYVEIPGTADPERINSIIMGRGRLAFHIVDDEATSRLNEHLIVNPAGIDEDLVLADPTIVPAGYMVRKFFQKDEYGLDEWTGRYLVITERPGLDGTAIQRAERTNDPITGEPNIIFVLDSEGGELFYAMTSANVGRTLAVVLDDRIKAGARISEAIRESVRMTGFSAEEAADLALILRTAALPIELIVESQQAIGASLGADSILEGRQAVLISLLVVIGFMLIYYKGAGINAALAQVINLYLMLSILSGFNLTLTLPAIAGFVLTVGMSVDANVIIFERIKEEIRAGKGRRAAIEAGFDKAFWAILDGNLTTIIAALFLAQLGSGPIQGFAVSLAIGNLSSLFTSLFVSRLLFDLSTDRGLKRVSISWRTR